ncbi:protoheme IX farnesyltransferase, mitochondrial-like [Uloborus diversus]|uniref:protoheme IX farnesyltransferase, mitochondrial-like n=1 Tax=Uloborus diversus TaxID=327109 RepID=UPI0024096B59|nr:protoheme IX farnesyltransferase, mitochondrial-like [Uloborus diversus]
MSYQIFPYILKHHGSLKYLKCVFTPIRQKGFKAKKPAATILAASSNATAPLIKENSFKDEADKTKNIIGLKKNASPETSDEDAEIHFPKVTKDTRKNEQFFPSEQNFLKPVTEPEISTVLQKHIRDNSNKHEKENDTPVKLIDAVKPSDLEWHKQVFDLRLIPKYYKGLSKYRLSGLVVITTLAGYGMAPGPLDPATLLFMTMGTALTSAAANAINQILEVPYDSQMTRTKNRVLIKGLVTPIHAFTFALSCASIGLTTLYFGTTPLTAILGATNLILYTSIYTPLKRCSILNTWVGSVVGAIPPLMGWAACTGTLNSGAFLIGAILYAWQFPHFNALSWNLRPDYSRAGYRMTSVIDPALCRRTALRHSVLMLVLCSAAPLVELTTWTFAFDSLPLNCYLIYCAWQFYKKGDSQSSRKLFRLSLIHLPTLMFLMFIGKKYSSKSEKDEVKNL